MKSLLFLISAITWFFGIIACSEPKKNEPALAPQPNLIETKPAANVVSVTQADTSVVGKEDNVDTAKTEMSISIGEGKSSGEKSKQIEISRDPSSKNSKNEKKDEAYQSSSKPEVKEAPRHEAPNQGEIEKIKKEKEKLKRPK